MDEELQDILDFANKPLTYIIDMLKDKAVSLQDWQKLLVDYEPTLHPILKDHENLKDKHRKDGTTEKSSRICIGLEKLLSKRFDEFTFSIPVKRVYNNINDNATRQEIASAIEAIYTNTHINSVNLKRGLMLYASCSIFTIWYAVKKDNDLYGFHSNFKLKCKTYSPMNGVSLYPLINELDDMLAMSFEYTKNIDNKDVTFFETYTASKHYVWKNNLSAGGWEPVTLNSDTGEQGEDIILLGKIPGAFAYLQQPVYFGLTALRSEIEYALSRNSNVIAYNAAPIIKVAGAIKGEEHKGESSRVWRTENGGDVSYVSWNQAIEALKYHVDTMLKLYWMQAQIPDISFENMKGLGSIGFDARQTLLMDAHLKVGDVSGLWIEFFERECNVIKAFLAILNPKWAKEIPNVVVDHVITPYVQNDESAQITMRLKANGGKAIESQLESIERFGKSDDAQATLEQIQKENSAEAKSRADAFNLDNQTV